MTEEMFREDTYAKRCQAVVTAAGEPGIECDRTAFYPTGGGSGGIVARCAVPTVLR